MSSENFKEKITKSLVIKIIIAVIGILILAVYFNFFFTKGIEYYGQFLRKKVNGTETYYSNYSENNKIEITVKGIRNKDAFAEVIYNLPNNINNKYKVYFENSSNWDEGINEIKDNNGLTLYQGHYNKENIVLLDEKGEPIFDDIAVMVDGGDIHNEDYNISLVNIADCALYANEAIRGDLPYLLVVIFICIIILIDIKFPLFFFRLKHFIDVEEPEPSEFYRVMQKLSWYVAPVAVIILMIIAIV